MATAVEDILRAGDSELASIEDAIADLERRITEAQAELAAIIEARETQAAALAEKQAEVHRLEFAHGEALSYAQLAQKAGTANHQESIKAASTAKKHLQVAQKALAQLERESTELEQFANAREQELHKQMHLLEFERETRQAEMDAVRLGRDKAFQEVGTHKHAELLAAYLEKAKATEELRAQLIAAEVELQEVFESAVQELVEWPELYKDLYLRHQPDDATTRVISATMQYVSTLQQDVLAVNTGFPSSHWRIWDVLIVPEGVLQHPGYLGERLVALQRLLEEYRAYLATL